MNLVTQLCMKADELMVYARGVSNLNKPESDNDFGRQAMLLRRAADEITELSRGLEEAKCRLMEGETTAAAMKALVVIDRCLSIYHAKPLL